MRWCKTCGAALEADDSAAVRCPQCGAGNDPLPAQAPPSGAVKVLAAGGMVVLAAVFAILFFAQVESPDDAPSPRPRPARSAQVAPPSSALTGREALTGKLEAYQEDLCFVDAGGDEALDPVLWAAEGTTRSRVAAVDGRTGRGLWAAPATRGRRPLACVDRRAVIAGGEEGAVLALDARTGKERWKASLPDAAEEIVVGEGCVTVVMKGGAATGLKVDTGEAAPCASAPRPTGFSGAFWERARNPQVGQAGDVEIALSAKTTGTPLLSIEGRRGGAPLWERDLPARAPGTRPDMLLAISDGRAVVAATDVATGAELRLIGVEAASGKVLYEQRAGWSGEYVSAMKASGKRVYLIAGGALRAIEPATGMELWQATPPKARP